MFDISDGVGLTHAGLVERRLKAGRALAAVAARNVDAVGVALAQVVSAVAFIDVCAGGREKKNNNKERTSIRRPITVCLEHAGVSEQQDNGKKKKKELKKHNGSVLALSQFRPSLAASG